MIIDAHTHLFEKDSETAVANLLRSMDAAGIERAAVFASPEPPLSNEEAICVVQKHSDRLFAVGFVSPLAPRRISPADWKLLFESGAIRAVKFYLGYEYFYPNDLELLGPYFEAAEACGFPAIFHTGDTYSAIPKAKLKYAHPLAVDDVAVEFPNLNIIIAHFGNPWFTDAAAVLYKNANVYADISGWAYGAFSHEEAAHLTQELLRARAYLGSLVKLLFGSDYPISDQKSCVEFAQNLPVESAEKEALFFRNAKKLFRL